MKLSAAQLQRVEEQFGVQAVPEDNPAMPRLKEAFGEHTFFLDAAGLNIVEADASREGTQANVLKLASWSEDRDALNVHEPEVLAVTVEIGSSEPDPAS